MPLTATLAAGSALALASAAVFAYVGWRLRRRPVEGDHATAWHLFLLWWFATAAEFATSGAISLLAGVGWIDHVGYATVIYLNLALLAAAIFGLMYYLLYLFTGSPRVAYVLVPVYLFYWGLLTYMVTWMDPAGIGVGSWRAFLTFDRIIGPEFRGLSAALGRWAPIAGALAYLSLLGAADQTTKRYRIVLVAASVLAWAVSQEIASNVRLAPDWWTVANRLAVLAAAAAMFLAYLPPRWVRDRLNVGSIEDDNASTTRGAASW